MVIASARPELMLPLTNLSSLRRRPRSANRIWLSGLLLIASVTVGCGGATEKTTEEVQEPAAGSGGEPATPSNLPAADTVPVAPPGKIEMPAGVDPATLPTAPTSNGDSGKSGGIEMPNLKPAPDTVISQRPVLDDKTGNTNVKLTAAPWTTIEKVVADSGKICVVDIWSLSCDPCLKEFPGLVRLHQELGDTVTCISLNVDYDGRKSKPAETYRPRVEEFLASSNASFGNFLCETANEELYASLKIASIPAVLVYDVDGKLVRTFSDTGKDLGFGYADDIMPFVKALVAK